MSGLEEQSKFMFYTSENGVTNIKVILGEDTVWVNQLGLAEIFNTTKQNISLHLNNIYKEAELNKFATVKEILTVQKEGNRNVQRNIEFYNLDAIISVGYRINSNKATLFRIWATSVLKEYLVKGFSLDDDRLKQGKNLFDKDYFDELVERIREIRASERRFYQKITDIYATSIDYDTTSPITKTFFATVQNKLEFAITKHTAPELIKLRASSEKPNMGLTSWKNEKKGGKILKTDVRVAKNYLEKEEITELNRIVTMYLDYAENQAEKGRKMSMKDWVDKLDAFLVFNEYNILKDAGKVRTIVAKKFAEEEYKKYRILQDNEYESDFDKLVSKTKKGKISE
ncbi:virulence RhuM family protein [Tenacibaculum finnmarkense genomovar ulcerans]|uniref:virulence RhuM family protein n=1 Tax=Tenacibaculum finnmarkense TaxID=2781243 RepID=UPI001E4A6AEA|nr:virulence RhuM family protein [Tenacibaculum finnmarkense]MCD8453606.1 virulence RhuM family protein [Tenacibaculum finnmarkense genomovar ulcerans]